MQVEQLADVKVLATGLRFPEGPVALADGSIVLVEIEGGRVTRVRPDGAVETVGRTGGGIERVDPVSGAVTRLYDRCEGHHLCGPNDLVFDRHGGFYFTDTGRVR